MRKFLQVFSVLLIGIIILYVVSPLLSGFADKYLTYSACDKPVYYRIGTVDPRFNVPEQDFLDDVQSSATAWNLAWGEKLLAYSNSPKALSINLVYDNRQKVKDEVNELEVNIKGEDQSLKAKIADYEARVAKFQQGARSLNERIVQLNVRGGATFEEYDKFIKEQKDLETEAAQLNAIAKNLNRSTDLYNSEVANLNQAIDNFKAVLSVKPEEGLYDPSLNRIDIYFNNSKEELVRTIMHELGHSLGLGHLPDKNAVMYSRTNQVVKLSPADIKALNYLCRRQSIPELIKQNFSR